jgi:hypothetical protein
VPAPGDHDFGLWHYDLGPSDKPNVGIVNLVGSQGRVVVPGLCELDGATLRIVLGRITPTRAQPIAQVEVAGRWNSRPDQARTSSCSS